MLGWIQRIALSLSVWFRRELVCYDCLYPVWRSE